MPSPTPWCRGRRDSIEKRAFGSPAITVTKFTLRSPTQLGCRIHRLLLCRGVTPPSECFGYDTKESNHEVPVMLYLWGMRNTPSLQRGKSPTTSVLDVTLNNLMVKLQWCWSFGECGVPLHCHRSQVHSGLEW